MKMIATQVIYALIWAAISSATCYLYTGQITSHDLFICWAFGVLCMLIKVENIIYKEPKSSPINELFNLKEYTEVWVKYRKSGIVVYGEFTPMGSESEEYVLNIPCYHEGFTNSRITAMFDSFILATTPKF